MLSRRFLTLPSPFGRADRSAHESGPNLRRHRPEAGIDPENFYSVSCGEVGWQRRARHRVFTLYLDRILELNMPMVSYAVNGWLIAWSTPAKLAGNILEPARKLDRKSTRL